MSEQVQAGRDAEAAQADIDLAQKQIDREREEIRELRKDAKREETELIEAEDAAAAVVRAAAARLPDIQLPGGAASPSAYAGTPFGGPLALDPRWASGMQNAAANEEPDDENSGNLGDFLSGAINETSFGLVDLGGDKDSGAYKGGQGASYIPWNPASALKSAGTGIVKGGAKVLGKEGAKEAGEAGVKKSADDVAGAGGRGGGAGALPIPPPKRWGPHNGPGPVGEDVAKTFRSASYTERVTTRETYLYRAYGGDSRPMGRYWAADPPAGPLQTKMDSALPPGNTAERSIAIRVPPGTTVYEGKVAPNFGHLGGGDQVVIEGKVPKEWIVGSGRR